MVSSKSEPIKTVLTLTVSFLIIFLLTKWLWTIFFSIIIGSFGIFSENAAKIIHSTWMKISWLLSLFIPKILLTIIFFFVLVPLALLYKIFGDKNQLLIKNTKKSLFIDTKREFGKDTFHKMW